MKKYIKYVIVTVIFAVIMFTVILCKQKDYGTDMTYIITFHHVDKVFKNDLDAMMKRVFKEEIVSVIFNPSIKDTITHTFIWDNKHQYFYSVEREDK